MYDEDVSMERPMKSRSAYEGIDQTGVDKITLMSAIEETTANAEKLYQMVLELLQRLEPIRSNQETVNEASMDEAVMARIRPEYGSQTAEQISRINSLLRRTQSYIARAMDDLDL